jgi:hypothetical protein
VPEVRPTPWPSAPTEAALAPPRSRAPLAIAAVVVLALLALGGALSWRAMHPDRPPAPAIAP